MKDILVTVILSFFLEEECTLLRSINSILSQTYKKIEFIIVNDGCHKDPIIPNDKRIEYIKLKKNLGLAEVLNLAIDKAKGDYIVRQDADDISFPHRIETLLNTIVNNPHISIVGSSSIIIDQQMDILGHRNVSNLHKDLIKHRWKDIPMLHPSWIFKKSWFIENTKYSNLRRGQDQFLLITNYKINKIWFKFLNTKFSSIINIPDIF